MTTYTITQIENLWMDLEDVTMLENDNGELVLTSEWLHFPANTSQNDIWEWFDNVHPKGVSYLANEFEYQA